MEKCKKCKKNYKMLTSEGLCAFCYKEKYFEWAKEFSYNGKKDKGK